MVSGGAKRKEVLGSGYSSTDINVATWSSKRAIAG